MFRSVDRIVEAIAKLLALIGGAVLLGIVILTSLSIIGRALVPLDIGIGPIRGIYDFTEIGMAIAIFAFLPLTQYNAAHARVDLFQFAIPTFVSNLLDVLFQCAMFAVALIGTYRLYLGAMDKMSYGETTLIAQIPVWYGYAGSLIGGVGFILVAAYCVIKTLGTLFGLSHQGDAS